MEVDRFDALARHIAVLLSRRRLMKAVTGGLAAADALLRRAEVPPGARPESLEPARFVRVAEELARGPALPQTTG